MSDHPNKKKAKVVKKLTATQKIAAKAKKSRTPARKKALDAELKKRGL